MFYSHEILTSPEHGVATIWLVATLGSRSITRRLNRKSILDVDVPEACRVIVNPEAPMALRLQGSLLYGVSRVYDQQCGYTLLDVQSMHDKMHAMLKVMPGGGLSPTAGQAKPGQLILPYDPSFLPETGLPGLDINFSIFDTDPDEGSSQRLSTIWSKSPTVSHSSLSQVGSVQLELPLDDIIVRGAGDLESEVSAQKRKLAATGDEEGVLLQPDFEFDENGDIVELDVTRMSPQRRGRYSFAPMDREKSLIEDMREEEGISLAHQTMHTENDALVAMEVDAMDLDTHPHEHLTEQEEVGEAREVKARHAKRQIKLIIADDDTALRNAQLAQWNEQYCNNMAHALKQKQLNKIPAQAKRHAAFWVFGQGLGAVGIGLGVTRAAHPLKPYSGDELYDAICAEEYQSGRKRVHEIDDDSDVETSVRRVRAREEQEERFGTGDADTGQLIQDVEVARHAPSSLYDEPSSQMPWNITASVQSSQCGPRFGSVAEFSSRGLPESTGLRATRPPSRLTSASPLALRSHLDGRERSSSLSIPGYPGDELGDLDLPEYLEGELAADREDLSMISSRRRSVVELVASTLDRENLNFLEFIESNIEALAVDKNNISAARGPAGSKQIAFSTLLPPGKTTRSVATQGLVNVLTLATKGVLAIHQDPYTDESSGRLGTRYRYSEILLRLGM